MRKLISKKTQWIFLILVLVQGMHSIEEYLGEIWVDFPPARFLCSLISDDPATGFLIINTGLFVLGSGGWLLAVKKSSLTGFYLLWFWIVLEFINGMGHILWTFSQNKLTPGIWTAPILLLIAIFLLRLQLVGNTKPVRQ